MFKFKKEITTSVYWRKGLPFCLLFTIASLGLLGFFWRKFPPEVPLFYSRPWGEEILTSSLSLLFLPLMIVLVSLLNLFLVLLLQQNRLLVVILTTTSVLFAFLVFWTLIRIIELII